MKDSNDKKQNIDVLGIKPYGEALNEVVKKTFEGIESFLKATCMPALEEIGLMMHDKVRVWRLTNMLKIIEKAKGKINYNENTGNISINPKVALAIIENGSNEGNDQLQEMWAGLFVTATSETGEDDNNTMYVNLLKQLTLCEAKYLKYTCSNISALSHPKWEQLHRRKDFISIEKFMQVTEVSNKDDVEGIFQHMISLNIVETNQNVTYSMYRKFDDGQYILYYPSTLGLQLYLRCIAFKGTIQEYLQTMPIQEII